MRIGGVASSPLHLIVTVHAFDWTSCPRVLMLMFLSRESDVIVTDGVPDFITLRSENQETSTTANHYLGLLPRVIARDNNTRFVNHAASAFSDAIELPM